MADDSGALEGAEQEEREPDFGDPTLVTLVRLANAGTLSVGVTLTVGGAVISGLLVGSADFWEGLADYLEQSGSEGAKGFAEGYREGAKNFREEMGDDIEKAVEAPYVATYVHLRDARVFTPSGYLPGNEGLFWRGRLESVDGWSFGNLGT